MGGIEASADIGYSIVEIFRGIPPCVYSDNHSKMIGRLVFAVVERDLFTLRRKRWLEWIPDHK